VLLDQWSRLKGNLEASQPIDLVGCGACSEPKLNALPFRYKLLASHRIGERLAGGNIAIALLANTITLALRWSP